MNITNIKKDEYLEMVGIIELNNLDFDSKAAFPNGRLGGKHEEK